MLMKVAAASIGLLFCASPCLALTFPSAAAPVSTAPKTKFADPDAALEQTGSAIQDSYVRNSLTGSTASPFAGSSFGVTSAPFGFGSKTVIGFSSSPPVSQYVGNGRTAPAPSPSPSQGH